MRRNKIFYRIQNHSYHERLHPPNCSETFGLFPTFNHKNTREQFQCECCGTPPLQVPGDSMIAARCHASNSDRACSTPNFAVFPHCYTSQTTNSATPASRVKWTHFEESLFILAAPQQVVAVEVSGGGGNSSDSDAHTAWLNNQHERPRAPPYL
jgi:hypothetical protein